MKSRKGPQKNGKLLSPWTIKGDLSTVKAIYNKWLRQCITEQELPLVTSNPFDGLELPKCNELDVRTVTVSEYTAFLDWLAGQWSNWKLPETYIRLAIHSGWRATEIASLRTSELLPGSIRVLAEQSKNRTAKISWLPDDLHAAVKECAADGYLFGRFASELRRHLLLWKKTPHIANKVKDFKPSRLVGWMQDQLQQFHEQAAAAAAERDLTHEAFTLHDLRRTAISELLQSGASEKEVSVMVGATPEVIRKHYEKLNKLAISKRCGEQRLKVAAEAENTTSLARPLRAGGGA
ncbi:MAG: tyrosine-type recombinase/integrase [Pirellulaceae bacterium]